MAIEFTIDMKDEAKFKALIRAFMTAEKWLTPLVQDAQKEMGEQMVKFIKDGIENRRSGWPVLHPITVMMKGHDKPLQDTLIFIYSMRAWGEGETWFAGLPDTALGKDGKKLVDVGYAQEYGATVMVTDKMRQMFSAKGFHLRKTTLALHIPPRPWFKPARDEFTKYMEGRVKKLSDAIKEKLGV